MAKFELNLIPTVMETLRLQTREEFHVIDETSAYLSGTYCFDRDEGLLVWDDEQMKWVHDAETEDKILNGSYVIHTDWKPKRDELFWYVKDAWGTIAKRNFDYHTFYDRFLLSVFNCFPTKEAAEMSKNHFIRSIDKVLDSLTVYVPPVVEEEVEDVDIDLTMPLPCDCECCKKKLEDEEEKNPSTDEKNS